MRPISRLRGVAATCLGPLHARALETRRACGILSDPKSVELAARLGSRPRDADWTCYQLQIAIRTEIIDGVTSDFMSRHRDGVVVNLGAGMDTRFERLDNGHVNWYDVDLPRVTALRSRFFAETARYHLVPASVVHLAWTGAIQANQATLFIMEGLMNYLPEAKARRVFQTIIARFNPVEIVMEALGWLYVRMSGRPEYKWGMTADSLPTEWDPRARILDSWCMYDRYPERWQEASWLKPLMAFGKNVHVIFHIDAGSRPGDDHTPIR